MTHVMFHVLLFLSAFSCVYSNNGIEISVTPSMDEGPIIWHQTVTVSCTWTPSSRMYGDILVGGEGESIWMDSLYKDIIELEDPEARLYLTSDDDTGVAQLLIKEVTAADERQFECSVSRLGSSEAITLDILEPPATGVTNFAAVAEFTTVALTWDAVEGATNYNVAWRSAGGDDWTAVDVATTTHTFEGLTVASNFEAKVDASNDAGIREGIEPAETTFTTKDNRPPHPVGGLIVQEDAGYNQTSITISWNLDDNTAESRIVTGIDASVAKEDAGEGDADIDPQELGGDATSATFELGGPGVFVFTVSTVNDYSADVDTSRTVSHLVKITTDPPTVKPTTTPEPTTKKPTTEPEPTTKAKTDPKPEETQPKPDPTVPVVPKNVDCGDTQEYEPLTGKNLQLKCTVPADAVYNASAITWTYQAGDEADILDQAALENSGGITIAAFEKTDTMGAHSILNIAAVSENNAGTYTCTENAHSSTCPFVVTTVRDVDASAVYTSVSTALSLVIFLLALF